MENNEKLSPFHTTILVFMIQSGVMALILPQLLAETFGTNGWITVFGFGIIATVNILLIAAVYKLGKGRSIFQILEQSIPRFMLIPIYLALAVVWTLLGCMAGKEYILIFQMYAFPTTNPMEFKLIMDLLVFWLLTKGLYNITKTSTIFFWLFIWMVLLAFFFYSDFNWARLTPFLFKGGKFTYLESLDIYSSFLGYEIVLLLFAYTNQKTKLIKATLIGNSVTTLTYCYLAFITFGVYSLGQLKNKAFPVLEMMAYIRFPFMERMENLLFGFILFTVLFSILMYEWCALEMLKHIFPKLKANFLAFMLMLMCFIVAYIPDTINDVGDWLSTLSMIECGIAFGLPLLLLIVLMFQSMGSRLAHE
ncbi:spore germination protein (amino acid permease) [Paenibacillus catalpae]|uniref:Spore germination protein (Amino acid permease) n=1 Tax=Paenibacillus catalpae TaxID=1045775 RepID=A0A1I1VPH4_9BACL|nr:GerAB/ArcD/ProY family transporter [Paenibacillus catalpae]SFD82400.1 spore germination protein (amino acid permease) [Paenibacillus catalpae]